MIHDYSTGELPKQDEQTWNTNQLMEDFIVIGFAAPYVRVVRKSDNKTGTLQFTRIYWGFQADAT